MIVNKHETEHEFRDYRQNTPHQLVVRIGEKNYGAAVSGYEVMVSPYLPPVQMVIVHVIINGELVTTPVLMTDCSILSPAF